MNGEAATALLVAGLGLACAKMGAPGFPPPARPAVLVPSDYETTFNSVARLIEARGMPLLLEDQSFGTIQTDWVYWDAGEVDLQAMADCDLGEEAAPTRTRARFAFDVRRRANRASVQILTQWQAERHAGFDDSDRGFTDCRSTGEWERMMEQTLTQRTTIR
jgi:uncharacterized lipoprotein